MEEGDKTIGDFSNTAVKSKANEIYELFERDYRNFHNSKSRAIAYCDRELRKVSDEDQRDFLVEIKKELIKNF